MPKAVLSNRIFLETDTTLAKKLNEELTYVIPPRNSMDNKITIRNMKMFKGSIVSIPSGREDLIPSNYDIVDKRVTNDVEFPEFKGTLRPSQQEIYDEIEDSAMINAWVSFGKTYTALAIAAKLGQKTLVVTHTVQLRRQWEKEVKKVFDIEAGIIGSGKFNIVPPIVIGNVQTLYNKMDQLYNHFGLVILDEFHHISAPTFARILDRSAARYKIGLSGTMKRKDGKHVVFKDYFGSKIFQPPAENYMEPQIHIHKVSSKLHDSNAIPWANKVTILANDVTYQKEVALLTAAYAAKGHKVLVVSMRLSLLKACAELIGPNAVCVTGEDDEETRLNRIKEITDGDKNVLLGTQSIFSEGISIDELSCLVLATPINNEPLLTQLIGRVLRLKEGKPNPIIVDINVKGKTAQNQARQRVGLYIKKGWRIVN